MIIGVKSKATWVPTDTQTASKRDVPSYKGESFKHLTRVRKSFT